MSLRNFALAAAGAAALGLAAPSAADAQAFAMVTTDLNLRASPGGAVIGTMPRGAQVQIHQCLQGRIWCQVTYAGTTGWASERYLDTRVAAAPPTQRWATPAPTPRFHFGFGVGRHAAPLPPWESPWHARAPGWYGDHYWDGRRWYYDDGWHARPRAGFFIGFGN